LELDDVEDIDNDSDLVRHRLMTKKKIRWSLCVAVAIFDLQFVESKNLKLVVSRRIVSTSTVTVNETSACVREEQTLFRLVKEGVSCLRLQNERLVLLDDCIG
jgi:hypothetical protein